jgi:hypothetical protein
MNLVTTGLFFEKVSVITVLAAGAVLLESVKGPTL